MTDLTAAIHFAEIAMRHEASAELRRTLTDDEWYDLAAAAVHAARSSIAECVPAAATVTTAKPAPICTCGHERIDHVWSSQDCTTSPCRCPAFAEAHEPACHLPVQNGQWCGLLICRKGGCRVGDSDKGTEEDRA